MLTPPKGLPAPWLTPFHPTVLAGLRPNIKQFADGTSTILTPNRFPSQQVDQNTQGQALPVGCNPPKVAGYNISPVANPYLVGTSVDLSPRGVTGTGPFTYQWYISGVLKSTSANYTHTWANADVIAPDAGGLGYAFIQILVYGQCEPGAANPGGSTNKIPVQK